MRPEERNGRADESARAAASYQLAETLSTLGQTLADPIPWSAIGAACVEMIVAAVLEAIDWERDDACPGCGCTELDACIDDATGESCRWTNTPNARGMAYCSACADDTEEENDPTENDDPTIDDPGEPE